MTQTPVTIGRSPDNKLILKQKKWGVSRQHACVDSEQDRLHLIDLDSTNGTYVGKNRIQKQPLYSGAKFSVGTYQLTVKRQVQCQCERLVTDEHQDCPWCGHFLADAVTQIL